MRYGVEKFEQKGASMKRLKDEEMKDGDRICTGCGANLRAPDGEHVCCPCCGCSTFRVLRRP